MPLIDMSETYQMTNVGDHIDGTDVYQSNRNLLDNAYFVGGGSQLGDGIFPINQRGQTQYTGGGVQLDRWHGWAGTDTLVLTSNGLEYTSPSSNGLFQYFPVFPTTQTVTFSVKINGTITSITLAEGTIHAEEDFSGYKLTVDRNNKYVSIFSLNETILLQAAKLEVGTVSTLANDPPPDFGEELRKCQRYLRDVSLKRTPCYFDGTYSVAVLTLTGIEMAKSPTPSLIAAGFAWQPAASASANLTAVSLITFEQYTPTIQFPLSTALSGMGMIYDTVIRLSCEL